MAAVAPVLVEGATGTAAAATAGEGAAAGRAATAGSVGVGKKPPARPTKPAAGTPAEPPTAPADEPPAQPDPDPSQRPQVRGPSPALERSVSRASAASGGVILGVLFYVLGLTYLRDGGAGVKAWLKAKFINETTNPQRGTVVDPDKVATPGPTQPSVGRLTVGRYW